MYRIYIIHSHSYNTLRVIQGSLDHTPSGDTLTVHQVDTLTIHQVEIHWPCTKWTHWPCTKWRYTDHAPSGDTLTMHQVACDNNKFCSVKLISVQTFEETRFEPLMVS